MEETTIGAVLFDGIEENPYLNELYDAILYNYGRQLFGLTNLPEKEISVPAALRFADILSKSVHTQNEETHKLWAQEIVALLNALHPDDELIQYYLGSVLTSVSNFRGVSLKAADYVSADLLDRIFTQVSKEYLRIPEAENEYFFRAQKEIYEKFNEPYFSYSAPTSLGKSYIMRTFIREQIAKGRQCNFAIIVPTKALINETTEKLTEVLGPELKEKNYRIVTSAGAMALEEEHNFIFAMTPERLLYLLILMKDIPIEYLFIDEAHKISKKDGRSAFYYKVVDMLSQRSTPPHIIFASPNIPNPEVYLQLIPDVANRENYAYVNPVFVIQVQNQTGSGISDTDLDDCLRKIEERTGFRFQDGEVVHTFGQTTSTIQINGVAVRYLEPSRIADEKNVKVVFFKENLSTGWDCPRAETMMSFRRATDATYIAQLLGRMVRTPMQMHIQVDDVLNDVHLYLPYFDAQTVEDVVKALQSTEGGEIPTDVIGDSFENSTIETWTVRPTRPAPAQRPARPKSQVPGQISWGDNPSPETGYEPAAQEPTQQIPAQGGSTIFGTPAAPTTGTTDTVRPVSGVSTETPANGAAAETEPTVSTEPEPTPEDIPGEPELDREAIVKAINDAGLLTYDVRRVRINDYLKSLFSLTRLLTQSGLQPSASYDVVNEIVEMIRSFIKKKKDEGRYDELATQVLQFKLKTQTFDVFGESVDDHAEMDLFSTTDTDLDRQFRLAELKLGNEGVGIRYGTRYADDDNPAGYKIDVIIFAADADCMDMLHNYARSRFHDINDANRRRITGLTERYRKKYDSIVSDGDIISKHNFRLPETISIERSNVGEAYTDHLFVDNATGKAVINLNNWEKAVLQAERGRSDYICWLRNPPRKSWSLCIPYEQNAEKKSMYPDFLIIRKDEMGFVIDILEPHDGTRTDNLGKAKGFAEYARQNPGVGRLQLIRLLNGRIKRLDMSRSAVRDRVSHAMSNDELDHIFDEDGFFG